MSDNSLKERGESSYDNICINAMPGRGDHFRGVLFTFDAAKIRADSASLE